MPVSSYGMVTHAVPVRTVGEQAYRIRELRVRFFKADMMFKPSPEVRLSIFCPHLPHAGCSCDLQAGVQHLVTLQAHAN